MSLNRKNFIEGKIGEKIIFLPQCASTNDLAKEYARMGEPHGTVLRCNYQTAGRGKEGKKWISIPFKGLYFSIILRPEEKEICLSWLPHISAISICLGLRKLFKIKPLIKWPNDVYLHGKKICGILIETSMNCEKLEYAILGIGININQEEKDFPEDLRGKATSLRIAMGREISIEEVFKKILEKFNYWYETLLSSNLSYIQKTLNSLSLIPIGSYIEILDGKIKKSGEFRGFDINGALLLKNEENIQRIYTGEMISFIT